MPDTVSITPMGRREWGVCLEGRIIGVCTGAQSRNDAETLASGLRALQAVPVLETQIQAMAEVVAMNSLRDYFRGVFERMGKRA